MLQKQTVEKKTFQLIERLQTEPLLSQTRLVGGTSLALQIAHRRSTDIDLFTTEKYDFDEVFNMLSLQYGLLPTRTNPNTIIGFIDDIKVDVIYHPFVWIDAPVIEDDLRLASVKDITAMKIHAITNSGQRPKDFVDIAYLSTSFSYNTMKEFALEKYPAYDPIMFDKAINYFEDIDRDALSNIKMVGRRFSWIPIEKRLLLMTAYPDQVFADRP